MHTIKTSLSALTAAGLFAGTAFAQAPASATTTTTTVASPAGTTSPGSDVGVSSRDGVTMSGADVLVTRNGVTEKLTKELELPGGLRVLPDGTVVTAEGGKITLRPTQVLTFQGKFLNAPIRETGAAPVRTESTSTTTTTNAAAPATTPANAETKAATPAAADTANAEADRRAKAASGESAPKPDAAK